jgi:Na+/H+-dicarboxylate symporter
MNAMNPAKTNLTKKMSIATVLGVVIGAFFGERLQFLKIIGDIFLRLVQMNIVLLVLGHIIEAVGSFNPKELGKIGAKTCALFLAFSLVAAAWGVLAGTIGLPGMGADTSQFGGGTAAPVTMGFAETLLSFVPTNIVGSMADGSVIHVLLFGALLGIALGQVTAETEDRRIIELVSAFNKAIIKIIGIIMRIAPPAICAIMITTIGRLGVRAMLPLAKYLLVYLAATLAYWFFWLAVLAATCKARPLKMIKNLSDTTMMAITTTSSAITLPTALRECQEKCGIGSKTANLVLPLGMTLNSNGAAMHMAITTVTIAQMYRVEFGRGQLVYVALLATFASVANAVMPGASMVSLAIMVPAMGLPLESVAVFAGVDYFVGMLRTFLNVNADVYTAMIVAKTEGDLDYAVFNAGR